ncbi:MAG: glycosyltransferase family 4 protein [Gammaproteobacteria bacterium]|nr:glycosyltransferase family 4 protein [Gammaproteobacteria bacterium]
MDRKSDAPLRVLVVHNHYQHRGGEDAVVESEVDLLQRHGHEVRLYSRHNDELAGIAAPRAALQAIWSSRTMTDLRRLLGELPADVVHVHNVVPLVSPSVFWAARHAGVPVVQTLHNFRIACPQAMFLRDGRVCEDCLGRVPWRAVAHGCYRHSTAQSAVLALMLAAHRVAGTWDRKVSRYIALNDFCRRKFIEAGLPPARIVVKPNFVDIAKGQDLAAGGAESAPRRGLFVGRLSPEKGVTLMLDALRCVPGVTLDVAGDGPGLAQVQSHESAHALGALSQDDVLHRMRAAAYLVLPSLWYENFPRTLVEAFACGLPVIASRLGALAELVDDGRTGLLFEPGNSRDLSEKIAWAEANPAAMRRMGDAARAEYVARYTPERNYELLMSIYEEAMVEHERHHT